MAIYEQYNINIVTNCLSLWHTNNSHLAGLRPTFKLFYLCYYPNLNNLKRISSSTKINKYFNTNSSPNYYIKTQYVCEFDAMINIHK